MGGYFIVFGIIGCVQRYLIYNTFIASVNNHLLTFGAFDILRSVMYIEKNDSNLPAQLSCRLGYIFCQCFFFISFLMVDFGAPVAQKLIDRSSPKFQDWWTGVRA